MRKQPEIEQALAAWREDADRVFSGQCFSAETRPDSYAGHTQVDKKKLQRLAEEHSELFLKLLEHLSPLSQDVLIQYYLLRRTQEQIGGLLGVTQHALHYTITRAIEEIKGDRRPTRKDFEEEIEIDEGILAECFQPVNGNV